MSFVTCLNVKIVVLLVNLRNKPYTFVMIVLGLLNQVMIMTRLKKELTIDKISKRPKNMWRYKELLPLDNEPTLGLNTGFTPLIKANNLAKILGVKTYTLKMMESIFHLYLSKIELLQLLFLKLWSWDMILLAVRQLVI